MFYYMFVGTDEDIEIVRNLLAKTLVEKERKSTRDKARLFADDSFQIFFEDGMSRTVEYRNQDYMLELGCFLEIQLFQPYPEAARQMLEFSSHILENTSGDFLLESNGDTPVIMRKTGIVFVNEKYTVDGFPLDARNVKYSRCNDFTKV